MQEEIGNVVHIHNYAKGTAMCVCVCVGWVVSCVCCRADILYIIMTDQIVTVFHTDDEISALFPGFTNHIPFPLTVSPCMSRQHAMHCHMCICR